MTAPEQARFLYRRYLFLLHEKEMCKAGDLNPLVKELCNIFVDGILKHNMMIQERYDGYQTYNTPMKLYKEVLNPDKKFWEQVRLEIEKI